MLEFARYLYASGDYLSAAAEFERYGFALPASAARDSLRYQVGQCYEAAGELSLARARYQQLIDSRVWPQVTDDASYRLAVVLVKAAAYGDARSFIATRADAVRSQGLRWRMRQLGALTYLSESRFVEARHYLDASAAGQPGFLQDSMSSALYQRALQGSDLRRKSRLLGGLLSAALPGAGKIYAGRKAEGLYSMALSGLTGWQALAGWSRGGRHSLRGAIYGGIWFGLYLGNVYGSVVGVDLWNRERERRVLEGLSVTAFR